MPWLRGVVFTVLGPGMVAGYIPWAIGPKAAHSGFWMSGWLLIAAGAAVYLRCLLSFLAEHGTPAIFFTHSLRAIWGEEPPALVRSSLYRYSRNPMYLGVLAVVFGQALVFSSPAIAAYGLALAAFFHVIVTLVEEPHLRRRDPRAFEEYRSETPRWLGVPADKSREG